MMRNPEQTIGNLIDKQGVAFVGSIDDGGFPGIGKNMAQHLTRAGYSDIESLKGQPPDSEAHWRDWKE